MLAMTGNRILDLLPPSELARIRSHLVPVELKQHDVLYHPEAPIDNVYFVQSGVVSLVNISENGDAIEAGIVSVEGVVGGVTMIEAERSTLQVTVQIAGRGLRMATSH